MNNENNNGFTSVAGNVNAQEESLPETQIPSTPINPCRYFTSAKQAKYLNQSQVPKASDIAKDASTKPALTQ